MAASKRRRPAESKLDVVYLPIEKVKPYPNNPRNNQSAVEKVARSIKEFGWRQPIVVDPKNVIIAGHTRLFAAQSLGLKQVPVHVARGLTPAQVRAYRIADNRVGQESTWDESKLLEELSALVGDIDMSVLGFDPREMTELLGSNSGAGMVDEDEPVALGGPVVSAPGDVWLLGSHRLLCGDSTRAEDVAVCLDGASPHLMVTDPPYGVEYDADWRNHALRKGGGAIGDRAVKQVVNDHNANWSVAWSLFSGDAAYIWHADSKAHIVAENLLTCGLEIRAQIIWAKNNIVIGRGHYHTQHEPCWYAVRKGSPAHWSGSRKETTLWQIDKPMKSETGHSTQKPVECMRRPMENNSKPGDAVYEPFCGSGTSIIAAETIGRICCAIEINPEYVDMSVKRWQNFTGKQAARESDGALFDDLLAEAERPKRSRRKVA